MKLENKIKLFFYSKLLKLDCATCVSDSKLKKFVIRKLLNPIGYYFRKKNFRLKMKL